MKPTGIVRSIDSLGRIVIPTELRKLLNIKDKDSLEIFTDDNCIILKKYQPSCIFCGSMDDIETYKGLIVCRECMRKLGRRAEE